MPRTRPQSPGTACPRSHHVRKLATLLAAILFAGLGVVAPAAARPANASVAEPKVAIIVGAVHGLTDSYRRHGDDVYREAIKYTSNVVRVYSPNATWAKVKAAVNGASIVVYMGHGNGWPSPYTYDPSYTTKDGFGINYDVNGDGHLSDYEVKYYGEPYIRTLTPAPNAVVLLFHLCYAAGNSEPGGAEPTLSVAKQRADNFAAAFLKTGAKAVVAIGHTHDPYYIRELFSSRQTIEQYWRNAPDFNNVNVISFASTRNPGMSARLDPDHVASSYYRSLVGKMNLTTEEVTGAPYAYTDRDPASFVIPGNASPVGESAPLFGSVEDAVAGLADTATPLELDAMVRLDWEEAATATLDGARIFRVHTDQGAAGWMTSTSLTPRDMRAPRIWTVEAGSGAFSPNGDGRQDTLPISIGLSEPAAWTLRVVSPWGSQKAIASGSGQTASITWAPTPGSVTDGQYRWELTASDAWGNGPVREDGSVYVDTHAPDLMVIAAAAATAPVVSPNGDGYAESAGFPVSASEPGSVVATVRNAEGGVVASPSTTNSAGNATLSWTGRDDAGVPVADGLYAVQLQAEDAAGNRSAVAERAVAVVTTLARVRSSSAMFFPQDGDSLAASATLAFDLAGSATVTWRITDAAGTTVRTILAGQALEAGPQAFAWDGRNDAGAFVARGLYTVIVEATAGDLAVSQRTTVRADAFRIAASDTTPARGQRFTITVTSAEALAAAPRVAITQPGISTWTAATTNVSTGVYRVTLTLRASSAGTVRIKAYGTDSGHRAQFSVLALPLH